MFFILKQIFNNFFTFFSTKLRMIDLLEIELRNFSLFRTASEIVQTKNAAKS